ncbi:hypothetical protein [Methanoregula sp.]|uniref:hypothetical protein n=1 Tax=Methanoregula sp. TaxID=2052170 RepID=UPI003565776A
MNQRVVCPRGLLIFVFFLSLILPGAMADGTISTKTAVFFEQNGKPFDSPAPSPVAHIPALPAESNISALNKTTPGSPPTQVPAGRSIIDEISCWFAGQFRGRGHS